MSRKLISGQKPFTMLVPVYRKASAPWRGPSGNPDVLRQSMTMQHFPEVSGLVEPTTMPEVATTNPRSPGLHTRVGHVDYTTSPVPVASTGTVTVANNTFAGPTTILLGQYVLTTDVEFAVGGDVTATATNLATAINNLPGFDATPAGAVVTVTGPFGVIGNDLIFKAGGASPQNFTFNPADDSLGGAEPVIGPPLIS